MIYKSFSLKIAALVTKTKAAIRFRRNGTSGVRNRETESNSNQYNGNKVNGYFFHNNPPIFWVQIQCFHKTPPFCKRVTSILLS